MKIPTPKLLEAASKKRTRGEPSAPGEPSRGQRAPTSKRLVTEVPEPSVARGPPIPLEIDLTVDTPPEGAEFTEVPAEAAAAGGPALGEPMAMGPVAAMEPAPLVPSRPSSPEAPGSWEEGPARSASPPREQVPADSPRAEPEDSGGAGAGGSRPESSRDPLQVDGRWAEQVLSPAFAPDFMEALGHLRLGEFFRESFANVVKLASSLKAAKGVIHEDRALLRESRKEAGEACARAAAAEKALEAAMAARAEEMAAAEGALEAARTARAAEIEAAEGALEAARTARAAEIEAAEEALEAAEGRVEEEVSRRHAALRQMAIVQDAAEAKDSRISELTLAIEAAENRAAAASERAVAAEGEVDRAREAEGVAVAALAAAEGARAVEVETAVAVRAAAAIEEYKASERFVEDLADASVDVFLQGFQHGKEKIARDFDLPQALDVEPDSFPDPGH